MSRCRFGRPHTWSSPIYRDGVKVAPDDWVECWVCKRVEDSDGQEVRNPVFVVDRSIIEKEKEGGRN